MKYLITESQNDNLKVLLKQIIKSKGFRVALKSVNGLDNFLKIMDINSPMDFLHLFNDFDVVQSEEDPDLTLFRYRPKYNLMMYNRDINLVYINYIYIWEPLFDFGLYENEIKQLMEEWLSDVYNLDGVKTAITYTEGKSL